jgi:hypothetical protein
LRPLQAADGGEAGWRRASAEARGLAAAAAAVGARRMLEAAAVVEKALVVQRRDLDALEMQVDCWPFLPSMLSRHALPNRKSNPAVDQYLASISALRPPNTLHAHIYSLLHALGPNWCSGV